MTIYLVLKVAAPILIGLFLYSRQQVIQEQLKNILTIMMSIALMILPTQGIYPYLPVAHSQEISIITATECIAALFLPF
mgnify:CR=1 FL=1